MHLQYYTYGALGACLGVGACLSAFTLFMLRRRHEPNAFNPVTIGKK